MYILSRVELSINMHDLAIYMKSLQCLDYCTNKGIHLVFFLPFERMSRPSALESYTARFECFQEL